MRSSYTVLLASTLVLSQLFNVAFAAPFPTPGLAIGKRAHTLHARFDEAISGESGSVPGGDIKDYCDGLIDLFSG